MKKTLALYEPLPQVGGGQKVVALMAEALKERYDVTIFTPRAIAKTWWETCFGVDLSDVKVDVVQNKTIMVGDEAKTVHALPQEFDVLVNGEYFYWAIDPSNAEQRVIVAHDAHPLGNAPNYMDQYKAVCPSSFYGKERLEAEAWTIPVKVVRPPAYKPVMVSKEQHGLRPKTIVCVARFDRMRNMNSLPTVIRIFEQAVDRGLRGWTFIMAGWALDSSVFSALKAQSFGYPINFVASPRDEQLAKIYSQAQYLLNLRGIDIPKPPTAFSHEALGMVTIEAIAHGVVPIVHDFAGHVEVVPLQGLRIADVESAPGRLLEILECHGAGDRWGAVGDLRDHASKEFSREKFLADFEAVIS